MTTNSTQEAEGRVQALGASVQDGQRRLEIIRRVEAGEHQEPGTIAFYKQYGPLLVSLREDGALWLMDSVEATRALREARTFTAAEMRALYGFFWSSALVEVCDMALALGDDRTPEQVVPESAIGEATPEQWERYNQAYLKERYAWAERRLCIVVEYGHELEPHIDRRCGRSGKQHSRGRGRRTVPATVPACSMPSWCSATHRRSAPASLPC